MWQYSKQTVKYSFDFVLKSVNNLMEYVHPSATDLGKPIWLLSNTDSWSVNNMEAT